MKWYRRYRPKVHWWIWMTLMVVNLLMALLCAVTGNKFDVSMRPQIIFHAVMALFCYGMIRVWQHWIDNPKDYERLQQARLGRLRRRMGGDRGKKKETRKKKED